jgi:hypothetical protein
MAAARVKLVVAGIAGSKAKRGSNITKTNIREIIISRNAEFIPGFIVDNISVRCM